jgi:RNA-directed DNA polymerase
VARLCTKICTYNHHLALGLICSPILADQVLSRVDRRVGGACESVGLIYTRYVDDITISGPFNLEQSGFAQLVARALAADGFRTNPDKHCFGRLEDGIAITGLREVNGHLDVRREYVDELIRQIDDARNLADAGTFCGPYYTPAQIMGRLRFVCWVNPGRRRDLIQRYRSVRWANVRAVARTRGLESSRKQVSALPNPKTR